MQLNDYDATFPIQMLRHPVTDSAEADDVRRVSVNISVTSADDEPVKPRASTGTDMHTISEDDGSNA